MFPQIALSALRRLLLMALALSTTVSCYNPDYSNILYSCNRGIECPDGLGCFQKTGFCAYSVAGCREGGYLIEMDRYICPGDANNCMVGYGSCPATFSVDYCSPNPSQSSNVDIAKCFYCCKQN